MGIKLIYTRDKTFFQIDSSYLPDCGSMKMLPNSKPLYLQAYHFQCWMKEIHPS